MQSLATKVKPIPAGYHTVTPYLIVEGAPKLIDFLKHTFNAQESALIKGPDGRVAHAEVKIGDSTIMMSDATAQWKPIESQAYVYVEDVDAAYKRALEAGATSVREPKTEFYGDRTGSVKDPLGNVWGIATHVEDVSPEEMQKRMKAQGLGQ